jgi:hypothetical protein
MEGRGSVSAVGAPQWGHCAVFGERIAPHLLQLPNSFGSTLALMCLVINFNRTVVWVEVNYLRQETRAS